MSGRRPNVLLISCYELGHQPLGLASPLAFMKRAGFAPRAIDLALEPLDEEQVRSADFVGVSVPMHTALRIGLALAARIRELNPACHLCYFGLYAALNAEVLLASGASSVLGGEYEEALVTLVSSRGRDFEKERPPILERLDFSVPERSGLPALPRYQAGTCWTPW